MVRPARLRSPARGELQKNDGLVSGDRDPPSPAGGRKPPARPLEDPLSNGHGPQPTVCSNKNASLGGRRVRKWYARRDY
jgi:hypothetical protein